MLELQVCGTTPSYGAEVGSQDFMLGKPSANCAAEDIPFTLERYLPADDWTEVKNVQKLQCTRKCCALGLRKYEVLLWCHGEPAVPHLANNFSSLGFSFLIHKMKLDDGVTHDLRRLFFRMEEDTRERL